MENSSVERRTFRMHPKLLMDVIRRQAGSLEKALLEAVMNSIDARASRVDVSLSTTGVIIRDNGMGFPSREEIEKFFEIFGQPHDESEGKTYGTFRMGRGQLFAFGENRWESGEFQMEIDIRDLGLDYRLTTGRSSVQGCTIEIGLYAPLSVDELHHVERELTRFVRYSEVGVFVNGTQVNEPASEEKWHETTELAYFKITPGGGGWIHVYNLGVLVTSLHSHAFGASGTIVSRQKVEVNFARNDIMSSCPTWKRIQIDLRRLAGSTIPAGKKLSDSQRAFIWKEIVAGGGSLLKYQGHKIFVDGNGSALSLDQIQSKWRRSTRGSKIPLCFHQEGTHAADRIMQQELALVLSNSMLGYVGVPDGKRFLERLTFNAILGHQRLDSQFELVDFTELAERACSSKHSFVPSAELSSGEEIVLSVATAVSYAISRAISKAEGSTNFYAPSRLIRAGESPTAMGWTDGKEYIAVNRSLLKETVKSGDTTQLVLLMIHEYCHRAGSIGDHEHDFDFYRAYHDLTFEMTSLLLLAKQRFESTVLVNAKRKVNREERKAALEKAKVLLAA